MEIYIILVIMESFLQCNYLCTVQCVYMNKTRKTHFGLYFFQYRYIFFLSLLSPLYFFKNTVQQIWASRNLGLVYDF